MQHRDLIKSLKIELAKVRSPMTVYSVGSIASGCSDGHSDIDLIFVVDQNKFKDSIPRILKLIDSTSGHPLYSRLKTWKKLKIAKLDLLTQDYRQFDILICETGSIVKIRKPYRKLFGPSELSSRNLSNKFHIKSVDYKPLLYGKRDLPFDILAALRASLRGDNKTASAIIKSLAKVI